jgi:hypothetical protein
MHVFTLLRLATLLLLVPVASAHEKDGPPGPPPRLWRASASEQDGKVVIQIAKPEERLGRDGARGLEPGVKSLPATMVMNWSNLEKVTLGKTVQAFRVSGQRAEPKLVLKALGKPKGVAVFVRSRESDPAMPDPFYLALLREDALVLVVNEKDIYPQRP